MALFYTVGGLVIIFLNRAQIPDAFTSIFREAFSLRAAGGGAAGTVMANAVRFGVARGVFTNEAGLGSSVIINSASNVKEPVQQGMWGIFEVFFDTIVMCAPWRRGRRAACCCGVFVGLRAIWRRFHIDCGLLLCICNYFRLVVLWRPCGRIHVRQTCADAV